MSKKAWRTISIDAVSLMNFSETCLCTSGPGSMTTVGIPLRASARISVELAETHDRSSERRTPQLRQARDDYAIDAAAALAYVAEITPPSTYVSPSTTTSAK